MNRNNNIKMLINRPTYHQLLWGKMNTAELKPFLLFFILRLTLQMNCIFSIVNERGNDKMLFFLAKIRVYRNDYQKLA